VDLLSLTKDPVNATITINDDNYKVVEAKYGADTAAVQKEIDDAINHQNYQLTLNTANLVYEMLVNSNQDIMTRDTKDTVILSRGLAK